MKRKWKVVERQSQDGEKSMKGSEKAHKPGRSRQARPSVSAATWPPARPARPPSRAARPPAVMLAGPPPRLPAAAPAPPASGRRPRAAPSASPAAMRNHLLICVGGQPPGRDAAPRRSKASHLFSDGLPLQLDRPPLRRGCRPLGHHRLPQRLLLAHALGRGLVQLRRAVGQPAGVERRRGPRPQVSLDGLLQRGEFRGLPLPALLRRCNLRGRWCLLREGGAQGSGRKEGARGGAREAGRHAAIPGAGGMFTCRCRRCRRSTSLAVIAASIISLSDWLIPAVCGKALSTPAVLGPVLHRPPAAGSSYLARPVKAQVQIAAGRCGARPARRPLLLVLSWDLRADEQLGGTSNFEHRPSCEARGGGELGLFGHGCVQSGSILLVGPKHGPKLLNF